MPKSAFAKAVDGIQRALRPALTNKGFKVRGRTFNRVTADDLTQVINIQMGASDPPGIAYFPGLRENMHGLFTVNLGVYVPEVAVINGGKAPGWIQDYHCCVRARLGDTTGDSKDIWWHARAGQDVIDDVLKNLEGFGLPFLDRFATRDRILAEWKSRSRNMGASHPPRIVMALILTARGQKEAARQLLSQQALETQNPQHPAYVRELARKLSLGDLD